MHVVVLIKTLFTIESVRIWISSHLYFKRVCVCFKVIRGRLYLQATDRSLRPATVIYHSSSELPVPTHSHCIDNAESSVANTLSLQQQSVDKDGSVSIPGTSLSHSKPQNSSATTQLTTEITLPHQEHQRNITESTSSQHTQHALQDSTLPEKTGQTDSLSPKKRHSIDDATEELLCEPMSVNATKNDCKVVTSSELKSKKSTVAPSDEYSNANSVPSAVCHVTVRNERSAETSASSPVNDSTTSLASQWTK